MLIKFKKVVNDCSLKFTDSYSPVKLQKLVVGMYSKNGYHSITKRYGMEFTSGPDKLKVLSNLPEAFQEYQPPDISEMVKRLWEVCMHEALLCISTNAG